MPNGMALEARAWPGVGADVDRGAVVMGLDQHRAQITAEWIDTATGEVGRQRVAPGDRITVREFFERFSGRRLEVALEATTGWRFVVEQLDAVGAVAHLAEPAQASALRGSKKRAKTDRADARHLRELLMTGRLPESWIAPAHLLDLRAQVRFRHALVTSGASPSSESKRCYTTTGCPNGVLCSDAPAASGSSGPRCRRSRESRSTSRS